MKKKLLYETPQAEAYEVFLENACLQTTSDITTDTPDNPMPWGSGDED